MSDTIADKDKKKEDGPGTKAQELLNTYWWSLLAIPISVFTIGTMGLYMSKVAQSNILPRLPTDAPYTETIHALDATKIYYNTLAHDGRKFGEEMFFDQIGFLDTFKSSRICKLTEASNKATSIPNISNYMSKISNRVIQFNSNVLNLTFLNLSMLPEWAVMLIYGLFWYVFVICLFILNWGMTAGCQIYYLFHSLYETSNGNEVPVKYSSDIIGMLTTMAYKCIVYYALICVTFLSIFSGFSAIVSTMYSLILPLTVKYKTSSENVKYSEQNSLLGFGCDVLYYKKIYFLILTLLGLTYSYTKIAGAMGVVPGIIVALIVYFMGYLSDKKIIDSIVDKSNTSFSSIADNYKIFQANFGKKLSVPFKC